MSTSADKLIKEALSKSDPDNLGMILVHRGIVRGTSKDGKKIKALEISYSPKKIEELQKRFSSHKGIEHVKVVINSGRLNVGDEIMTVVVAGRFRKDVIPVFEKLLSEIKENIEEKEIPA